MTHLPPDAHRASEEPASGRSEGLRRGLGGAGKGMRATGRGLAGLGRATSRAGGGAVRLARRAARAEGAGDSGLSRLIELHSVNAAADAAVAISLAGTLFFQVPTGEARGQVALFLGLTMLPFVIVAPLIGPFLDRFSHGRRWAIGATMAVRGFLCWVLAQAVATESQWLFPAALGVLVSSKAYGVTRAAAVPRLVPDNLTLVKSNARVSLAGIVGACVSAPLAGLASLAGPEWSLRYAFVLFVAATVLAILLPARVDSSQGEGVLVLLPSSDDPDATQPMRQVDAEEDGTQGAGDAQAAPSPSRRLRVNMPRSVRFALLANCGPRWLSGFLTMFMAFLLRENPVTGWSPEMLLAVVIGGAGLGNALGIALGSLVRRINPAVTVVVALCADAAMAALGAAFYGVATLVALGLTAGMAQALAKLSLDSTIQHDVPERVRTSAFALSDTCLQLAWVLGGFVGIVMPLMPRLGLGIAAGVLAAWGLWMLVGARRAAARAA